MKRGKKAQMQLSFGMIFSIILIIAFLTFAFFAIKKFLEVGDSIKVGKFIDELTDSVDKMWKSPQGSQIKEFSLPKKIEFVCFVDFSSQATGTKKEIYKEIEQINYGSENLVLYPVGSGEGNDAFEIKHIDLGKITNQDNPFCFENKNGKISMKIKKQNGENLVTITR